MAPGLLTVTEISLAFPAIGAGALFTLQVMVRPLAGSVVMNGELAGFKFALLKGNERNCSN